MSYLDLESYLKIGRPEKEIIVLVSCPLDTVNRVIWILSAWVVGKLMPLQKYVGHEICPKIIKTWMMKKSYAWKANFDLTMTKVLIDSKALTFISDISLHFQLMTAILLSIVQPLILAPCAGPALIMAYFRPSRKFFASSSKIYI